MEVEQYRLECLVQAVKLAQMSGGVDQVTQLASEFYAFVKDGTVPKDEIDPAPDDEIPF